jgi:MFS family permease
LRALPNAFIRIDDASSARSKTDASHSFGPILGPIGAILVQEFSLTFSQVALLSGYCLCATGAIGLFVAAVCRKYGKRPALIFSMVCAFVGSAWAAGSKGHASFVGARWVQGFSMAFFESVMYSVIGDLYYVHERGLRTAIYIGMFSGLSIIPTLVSGIVAENLGWRWIFWLLTIFCGILLVFVILFGWESTYNRDAIYNVDSSSQDVSHPIPALEHTFLD